MAHAHDVDVVEVNRGDNGGGIASGFILGVVALLIVAIIAFGVLWTRPWNSTSHSMPNTPGISDNSGGGGSGGGGTGGSTSGGSSGGSTSGQ